MLVAIREKFIGGLLVGKKDGVGERFSELVHICGGNNMRHKTPSSIHVV
jgi:hypothetical protein